MRRLVDTYLDDEHLALLASSPRLQELWLNEAKVSGSGFAALTGLRELHTVHACDSAFTDDGVMTKDTWLPDAAMWT